MFEFGNLFILRFETFFYIDFISEMHKFAKFGTAYSSSSSRIVVVVVVVVVFLLCFFCFVGLCLVLSFFLIKLILLFLLYLYIHLSLPFLSNICNVLFIVFKVHSILNNPLAFLKCTSYSMYHILDCIFKCLNL